MPKLPQILKQASRLPRVFCLLAIAMTFFQFLYLSAFDELLELSAVLFVSHVVFPSNSFFSFFSAFLLTTLGYTISFFIEILDIKSLSKLYICMHVSEL